MPNIHDIVEYVQSSDNRQRIAEDYDRYIVYNGKLKEIIRKAIQKEFILPETIESLVSRIIPINITQKICNKLAAVYREAPVRYSVDGNEMDQESLDFYAEEMCFDRLMKHANRMFKLHKHVLLEPYVCKEGEPRLRVLPSHTYTPYSDDPIEPNQPTAIVKHIVLDEQKEKTRLAIWTDENHWIVNGNGDIMMDEMNAMNNPEGINPYGEMPFVYIKDSDDLLIPISDQDLISMQIAICLLLTDIAFCSKYASWGLIYLIGVESNVISFNPNSVITLPHAPGTEKPEIGVVDRKFDSDAMLRQVEAMVALLLTTKNLSVGSVSGKLDATSASSGVAKLIDQSDTTEERSDQVAFFADAEKDFWEMFAHKILPVWVQNGQLAPEYVKVFSDPFELGISFPDFRPMVGDKEKLEIIKSKLDLGLTTKEDALKELDPELTEFDVKQILGEVQKEKTNSVKLLSKSMLPIKEPKEPNDQQLN